MNNIWTMPANHRYCALCHFNVLESNWASHEALHERRDEVIDGKATGDALGAALYRNNDPQAVKQYRREVEAIQ